MQQYDRNIEGCAEASAAGDEERDGPAGEQAEEDDAALARRLQLEEHAALYGRHRQATGSEIDGDRSDVDSLDSDREIEDSQGVMSAGSIHSRLCSGVGGCAAVID